MQTGACGTPGTCRLIEHEWLRGVTALSILTTHVWNYGTPNGGPPAPHDSHSWKTESVRGRSLSMRGKSDRPLRLGAALSSRTEGPML
jgi:hypothetical protein